MGASLKGLCFLNITIVSLLIGCLTLILWAWHGEIFVSLPSLLYDSLFLLSSGFIAALHLPQRSKLQAPPGFTLTSSEHLQTCTTDLVKTTWRLLSAPQGVSRSLPLSRPGSSPEGGGCTSSGSDCPRWTAYVDGVPEICPDWFLPPRLYCEQKLPAW